ncbi:MAG TPA: Ig-like domain-containing protein, partial [Gemmatimonadales bacterium]|nr:Ig-like domain-containing protein [Gemmatimonadales bacterium]
MRANSRTAWHQMLGVVIGLTAACAKDEAVAPNETGGGLTSRVVVSIQPRRDSIWIGASRVLAARVTDQKNVLLDLPVTWSTLDPSVASVTSTGLVTAITAGTSRIVARAGAGGDTATITVRAEAVPFQVRPNAASIVLGESLQVSLSGPNGTMAAASGAAVTWGTSDPTVATISPGGVVSSTGVGDVMVTATIDGVTSAAAVRVSRSAVDAVIIAPTNTTITAGESASLTARMVDDVGRAITGHRAKWSSSNTAIVTVGDDGTVTGVTKGSAVITAAVESKRATATVNVLPVAVVTASVTLGTSSLAVGQTTTAAATLKDASGNVLADRTVSWQSSNPALVTINSAGLVTAIAPGNATILVISEGKTGGTSITITRPAATAVVISPSGATLLPDQTTQLTAQVTDATGNTLNKPITWTTNNAVIATVSSSGVVTSHGAGTAAISATADAVTASVPVSVSAPPAAVSAVSVTLQSSTLSVGQTTQATAVVRNSAGAVVSGAPVTWSSTDDVLATVSATGVVTARQAGSATIVATIEGVSGTQSLSITPPPVAPVATVTVLSGATSLLVGQTTQATALIRDAQGNALTGRSIGWSSSNPAVATVSVTGLVTAVAAGSVVISASSEGKTGTLTMTVTAPAPVPVATVSVALSVASLGVGATAQATATVRDAAGAVLTGRAVSWASSAPAVASVSPAGLVT